MVGLPLGRLPIIFGYVQRVPYLTFFQAMVLHPSLLGQVSGFSSVVYHNFSVYSLHLVFPDFPLYSLWATTPLLVTPEGVAEWASSSDIPFPSCFLGNQGDLKLKGGRLS